MASQEAGDLLEECLRAVAAAPQSMQTTEAEKLNYCRCRGQTQDGAIWLVFMWEREAVRLGFGWRSFGGGIVLASEPHLC